MSDTNDIVSEGCHVSTVKDLSMKKGITFVHWNAHSIINKFEEVVHIVASSGAECCVFTETWATEHTLDGALQLDNYVMFWQDRTAASGKSRGGGILAYCKSLHKFTLVSELCCCC